MSSETETQRPLQHALVKQVLSGDTIVVWSPPKGGPPQEKTIGLACVIAPRLARRPGPNAAANAPDEEPLAWESREFLRHKLVGREVSFALDYKPPSSNRELCWVFLGRDSTTSENIIESMVRSGLVHVKQNSARSNDPSVQRLIQLEEEARVAGRGLHASPVPKPRNIRWQLENPEAFVAAMRKLRDPLPAVVEYVRDAATVRVNLALDDGYHYQVMVALTGLRAPVTRAPTANAAQRDAAGAGGAGVSGEASKPTSEPFADESKYFVEYRLLQRDVSVRFDGTAPSGGSGQNALVLGTLLHPNGNIAELLLQEGFARCVDWSVQFLPRASIDIYRNAEKIAKEKKLRIWKNYSAPALPAELAQNRSFTGKVVEVGNGDWLTVETPTGEKKIFISSVRAPKLEDTGAVAENVANRLRAMSRPLFDVPGVFEAREMLRKKVLGREVNVSIDYVLAKSEQNNMPERHCCTVMFGTTNLAEMLVSHGLATVVRYRANDENRSPHYDLLVAAESRAREKGLGIFSGRSQAVRISDLVGDANRAKQSVQHLKRIGRMPAIVELVTNSSRLRIFIQRESVLVNFLLNGIESPRTGEEFGDEGLQLTRRWCLQRDVEVEIESSDRGGNLIGWLFAPDPNGPAGGPNVVYKNMSVLLLEAGLARVFPAAAERSAFASELFEAEQRAQSARCGIWSKEDPEETARRNNLRAAEAAAAASGIELLWLTAKTLHATERPFEPVVVTHIAGNAHVFVQREAAGAEFEQWVTAMRAELDEAQPIPGALGSRAHKGELCAVRFSQDDLFYRAKIQAISADHLQATVCYIDYGNTEVVPINKLAPLPPAYRNYIPQATEYVLAFIQRPKDDEDMRAMLTLLSETLQSDGVNVLLCPEFKLDGETRVSLSVSSGGQQTDVARRLLENGLAFLDREQLRKYTRALGSTDPNEPLATRAPHLEELMQAENSARQAHLNIWRFGDFLSDDA